jgi:S-DNA-T family DNA segregation ATPase FtsK/SpoIIIE
MSRHRIRRLSWSERINLNPEISHGILAILLFIAAGLSILSFFDMAGVVGIFIDSLLSVIFGQVRYVFPLVLIIVAVLIIKDIEYNYRPTHLIGCLFFFLSFNGLVHLPRPTYELAIQGYGGGLMGFALAWPLSTYIGYWGSLLILIGLLITSLIFIFNTSLAELIQLHKKLFLSIGWFGQKIVFFFNLFKKKSPTAILPEESESDEEEENEEDTLEEERHFDKKDLDASQDEEEVEEEDEESQEEDEQFVPVPKPKRNYKLPPVDLLYMSKGKPTSGDIKSNAQIIQETLENFGIEVEMGEIRVGPTVTQYSLKPARGVKLARIIGLSNDLALALAAHPIRIEAPIPGQSLVGIEVPNQRVAMVTLRELLESNEFKQRSHNMFITLGKDVAGHVWIADLPKMPHLLIAGATGSGKTVGINTIILSLLYENTPETLRFIMIDPKRVELTLYNGIPHLLTPVITDAPKTVNALKWAIGEMERRFEVLAKAGKRDIASYNATSREPLPYIVIVIDELADLMAASGKEIEAGIIRLAQMARAIGIHLIVATQRPSVEVITGLMKANIPGRIAFSVASVIDSRTILDTPGAEKLLGRGDMLLLTAELTKPKRVQGAFVSEEEMKRVVDFLQDGEPPEYDESIISKTSSFGSNASMFGGNSFDQDSLFEEARALVLESGKASASLLQRRLKVGYARAARLLDELEEAGIVGKADGAKPREVFTEHLETHSSSTVFTPLAEKPVTRTEEQEEPEEESFFVNTEESDDERLS